MFTYLDKALNLKSVPQKLEVFYYNVVATLPGEVYQSYYDSDNEVIILYLKDDNFGQIGLTTIHSDGIIRTELEKDFLDCMVKREQRRMRKPDSFYGRNIYQRRIFKKNLSPIGLGKFKQDVRVHLAQRKK